MIPKYKFYHFGLKCIFEVTSINFINKEVECIVSEVDNYLNSWRWSYGKLLQSTGLKDINGKEIFESYVVKVHAFFFDGCSESEKEHIGIIRYGNIAGFLIKEWYLETVDNKIAFLDLELHEESFEILGNRFEHPHLLGEE